MKKLFIAISVTLLLFSATFIHAQTSSNSYQQQILQRNRALMNAIARQQQAKQSATKPNAAKTTNSSEFLIAETHWDMDLPTPAIEDSIYYSYSGGRSSYFDFNTMQYEASNNATNEWVFWMAIGNYNVVNRGITLPTLYDTCYNVISLDTNVTVASYDVNNQLIEVQDVVPTVNPFIGYYKTFNTYNANEQITGGLMLEWSNSEWDSVEKSIIQYNGDTFMHRIDSQYNNGNWKPINYWDCSFNNAGNISTIVGYDYDNTTSTWEMQLNYIFNYNPDNTLIEDSMFEYYSGIRTLEFTDSVGYTAGASYITYEKTTDYNVNIPAIIDNYRKHITGGLPDTLFYSETTVGTNDTFSYKHSYLYDSYGNPLQDTQYNPVTSDNNSLENSPISIIYYHYQRPSSAVNNVVKQSVSITVYPDPATNEINISQNGIQPGAVSHIALVNALGQTVYSESLFWTGTTKPISVASLKPGNYWLVVQDHNGNVLGRKQIVKE